MKIIFLVIIAVLCSGIQCQQQGRDATAYKRLQPNELSGRKRFKEITGIDPLRTNGRFSVGSACPDSATIDPCICISDTSHASLDCSRVASFAALKDILSTAIFPSYQFDLFTLSSETIAYKGLKMLNDTFGALSFVEIIIEATTVQTIDTRAFAGSEDTLTKLTLHNNIYLSSFPLNQMIYFGNLKILRITNGKLDSVSDLGELNSLQQLDLSGNIIANIGVFAFSGLTQLQILDLGVNELRELVWDSIYLVAHWTHIFLDNNQLTTMTTFTGNQPIMLQLTYNELTTFEQQVYEPILDVIISCRSCDMTFIDITNNPVDCGEMYWVWNEPSYVSHVHSDCLIQHELLTKNQRGE